MDIERVVEFLKRLGAQRVSVRGKVVQASCPMAEWKHAGGHDANPSFAVFTTADGEAKWRCFGCASGGSLLELTWRLKFLRREDSSWMSKQSTYLDIQDSPSPEVVRARLEAAKDKPEDKVVREIAGIQILPVVLPKAFRNAPPPLPEDTLLHFVPVGDEGPACDLMVERGVSKEEILRWELMWHPPTRRLAIPIRDRMGRLVGVSGRAEDKLCYRCNTPIIKKLITGKMRLWCPTCERRTPPKYLHSEGFRRDFYLYGEHLLQPHHKVVYIVEGFFDVIALWTLGYEGAVAVMGTYLSAFQIEKIVKLFDRAVVIPDGDEAGRIMGTKVYGQLAPRMSVKLVRTPDGMDPDDFTPEIAGELIGPPPLRLVQQEVGVCSVRKGA